MSKIVINNIDISRVTVEDLDKAVIYSEFRELQKRLGTKTRVYIHIKGETLLENLMNRRQRPYTIYKKEVMPAVLEKMGLSKDTKFRWSQKAGCACGCSPGFIIDSDNGADVFVSISDEENNPKPSNVIHLIKTPEGKLVRAA